MFFQILLHSSLLTILRPFHFLPIALLQCNSRPRLGLALIVLAAGLLFIIGNPGLPASVGTHSESFLAAVTIAVWLFLPPLQQRPALLILTVESPVYKPTKMNERSQEILNAGG